MSDRAALLAAIVAHADEDTPRLVYADWLDENDEAKRAAYIRARVERFRAEQADTATNAVSAYLENTREYKNEASLGRIAWPGEIGAELAARKGGGKRPFKLTAKREGVPQIKGVGFWENSRGFFDSLLVEDVAAFLKHADAIFRAAPITDVMFYEDRLTAEQATELVRSGHLAHIRELALESEVDPGAVRILGSARDAVGVRKLVFRLAPPTAVVEALAEGTCWSGLEHLYLANLMDAEDPPTAGRFAATLNSPQFVGLRELVLWGNNIGDADARAIAKRLPELRHLDLAVNNVTGIGAAALAASKSRQHLRHLDLSSCDMEDGATAAAELINTKNLPNLCVLILDNARFDGPTPRALAKPGRGPTLRVLDLDSAHLTPKGIEALAKCPAVRGVWHLKLGNTRIGDDHFERFLAHAAFERLTCLDLHSNDITARGARALAAWPGAANLQWLDLGSNPIGESGAKAVAASPYLKGLKYVHFKGRGTAILKTRFKKAFA